MIGFLARRTLRAFLLLIAVSLLTFVLFELAPGDFFSETRLNSQITPETIAAIRSQQGLDRPMLSKYMHWLGSVWRGEWGYSFAHNTPVAPILWERAANTLLLTATAAAVSWLIAIPIAIWGADSVTGASRRLIRAAMSFLLAIPDVLIVLLFLLMAARTGVLPLGGMTSLESAHITFWSKARDTAAHLTLPVTALVLSALPILISHALAGLTEVIDSPFILAARANGIPRTRLLYRHVLPAAANPLVSLFGFSVGTLLSSSLLVEAVMGWPGLGRLLLEATLQRDIYVVIGAVILSAVFLMAGNLLADILLYAVDPRIRRE